jgi:uncharacterized membrane protein YfcA
MSPDTFVAVTFVGSIGAGTLGALLGLGGGVIIIPMLTLLFGLDIHYAVGASIVSVIATSSGAAATYVREHLTNLRVGMFLEIGTTLGAVSGAYLAGILPVQLLYLTFAVVMGYSGIVMLRARTEAYAPEGEAAEPDTLATKLRLDSSYYDHALQRQVPYHVQGVLTGLGLMYIAGIVSGLLGIGGGILKVPAMDLAMRLPIKVSSATSNFMIGVTAAASAGVYFMRGDIQAIVAAPVALGVVIGSMIGTRLLTHLPSTLIRRIFVIVLAIICLEMLARGLGVAIP